MKRFLTMLKIESKLAIRCPDGIIFGVVMPVGVLLLLGMIAGGKSVSADAGYTFLDSGFAALITVGICATAFMGIPLTLADYRDKKILKHYFVTPVSPAVIFLVQIVIAMLTAIVSAGAVGLAAVLIFGYRMEGSLGAFIGGYFLVMASMYSIGILIASVCRTVKIANVVCSAVYFPMLFLSGATIPYELFPAPMQSVANILPLTQGVKLLKGFSLGHPVDNLLFSVVLLVGVGIISILIAFKTFRWE